jgi:hypothetical protein
MEAHSNLTSFARRLRQPIAGPAAVVAAAGTRRELDDVLQLKEALIDQRLILILPDNEPDALTRGHGLRPRFMSVCDSDFSDVAAVLSNIVRSS